MQPHSNVSSASIQPEAFQSVTARRILGFWLLFQIIGGFIGGLIGDTSIELAENASAYDPVWSLIGGYIGWALFLQWVLMYLKRQRISVSRMIGPMALTRRDLWQAIGVAIGCLIFSMGTGILMFSVLSQISPDLLERIEEMAFSQASTMPFLYNLLLTGLLVVVAPTLEEFLFRGLLLHRWTFKWSLVSSIIVSSLLFGFAHINPVGLSLFGVMMALLYLKTRQLTAPVLAHAVNNAIVAVSIWLPQTNPSTLPSESIAMGFFCLALSLPLLTWLACSLWTQRAATLPYDG